MRAINPRKGVSLRNNSPPTRMIDVYYPLPPNPYPGLMIDEELSVHGGPKCRTLELRS